MSSMYSHGLYQQLASQIALVKVVEATERSWLPAQGVDPLRRWPAEPSLAVLDPTVH